MKITEIGLNRVFNKTDLKRFFSNQYFGDDSILFILLTSLKEELKALIKFNGISISNENISTIDYWVQRKKDELKEYYKHGGVIVIIADTHPLMLFDIDRYGSEYKTIDLIKIFKDDGYFDYEFFEGSDCIGYPPVKQISDAFKIKFHFTFKFLNAADKILFATIKSQNVISFSTKAGDGLLIVLPEFLMKDVPGKSSLDIKDILLNSIIELILVQKGDLENALNNAPDWTNQFQFSKASTNLQSLAILIKQKDDIERKINTIQESLKKYSYFKTIIYTKGPDLEIGVGRCLEHLQITFITPPGSNTDLIMQNGDSYFAVEIKGGVGSASKQHVRQLEEWVNSCAIEYKTEDCKGLLIMNSFCDIEINKRNPVSFPPNVIEFSVARNHCLMTTLTLLKLINDFDNDKIDKNGILNLIKKTVGILDYNSRK